MKITMLSIMMFFILGISQAQDTESSHVLTLEECINTALEHNNALKQKEYLRESAENDLYNSYSSYLPRADFSISSGKRRSGRSQATANQVSGRDTVTNELIYGGILPASQRNYNGMDFTVSQNIFDGERIANIYQAGALDDAAKFDLNSQKNQTILTVKEAYFNLIKQLKLEEVNKIAVERSQGQVDRTQKMFDLGAAAKLDVYQAKVNLGTDRISLLTQTNMVSDAKRSLNLAMGREPDLQIDIQLLEGVSQGSHNLNEMYDIAMENQPLIKMRDAQIESNKYGVWRAKSSYLPRLTGYFQYSRSHSEIDQVYSNYNLNWDTQIGLQLSVNLFNGFADYLNVQNAKISESQAKENEQEYIRNLKSSIKGYYDSYNSYLEIIEINEENLEAAREELRLAEERYQIGAGTSLEVREAQVKLTRAEQTLIAAQYNALITEAQLDNELGIVQEN